MLQRKKPRGRPRIKVLKKARNAPKAAILEFEARGSNQKLATHEVTSNSQPTCTSCGSKGHNALTCKSATIGDMFQRKLSTRNQLAHVSLPPPPPDDIIVVDDDASDIDCTDTVHLATRTDSFSCPSTTVTDFPIFTLFLSAGSTTLQFRRSLSD